MPANNRVPAIIQLTPGKDDDLIRWLRKIPIGGRNATLKTALRSGLDLPQPEPATGSTSSLEQLAALTGEVQALKAAVTGVNRVPVVPLDQLDQMGQLLDQMDRIQYRLNQLEAQVSGYPATPVPIIEAAPELTEAELAQRSAKLKKMKW